MPEILTGQSAIDDRGTIVYNNSFAMDKIKRSFIIAPANEYVQREWHGHKIEQNWFQPINGSFLILVVAPDNWENPSFSLTPMEYVISAEKNEILHIPGGYVTKIKPLKPNSRLMVFSSFTLEESLKDDFRFKPELWYYETFM